MATVRYLVDDVDASLPFYAALGFTVAHRPGPPIAILARADLTLWLSGPAASAARPLADGSKPVPGGWNRLVIEVDDLAASMATLRAAGVTFRSEPIAGPGGRQVLAEDRSGNVVELFDAKG